VVQHIINSFFCLLDTVSLNLRNTKHWLKNTIPVSRKAVYLSKKITNMKSVVKITLLLIVSLGLQQAMAQKINKKLSAQLVAIYKDDQQYRVAAIAAAKIHGSNSPQDKELMKKQDIADAANLAKVEKIIAAYGYPGKSMVGAQSKVVFMVVQHNELDAQEKYLPLFMEAAEKGELDRTVLPLMIDRVRTARKQPQVYGTQLHERMGASVQVQTIEDEVNVNIRRKAVGLPPLEDYLKHWGINYIVPTAAGNPNPKDLYYNAQERIELPIEAIGGDDGIKAKLIYPEKAKENNITGFVTVGYTVDKDGNTKNVEVVKGLGYGCDEEAIRVIKETKYTNETGDDSDMRMKLPFPYQKK
jgi:TonB family protein